MTLQSIKDIPLNAWAEATGIIICVGGFIWLIWLIKEAIKEVMRKRNHAKRNNS